MGRCRINTVVRSMLAADEANIDLPWERASAIDVAGRDILEAVKTSVDPKVIDVPHPGGAKTTIDAVAKDGIQLKAKARVTVRTNIARLVGGATEETIVARVGEGIVSAIGSAESHKAVLENPDAISKAVLAKGLDAGTAYEILSIDKRAFFICAVLPPSCLKSKSISWIAFVKVTFAKPLAGPYQLVANCEVKSSVSVLTSSTCPLILSCLSFFALPIPPAAL